jgi:hypothetical protein
MCCKRHDRNMGDEDGGGKGRTDCSLVHSRMDGFGARMWDTASESGEDKEGPFRTWDVRKMISDGQMSERNLVNQPGSLCRPLSVGPHT